MRKYSVVELRDKELIWLRQWEKEETKLHFLDWLEKQEPKKEHNPNCDGEHPVGHCSYAFPMPKESVGTGSYKNDSWKTMTNEIERLAKGAVVYGEEINPLIEVLNGLVEKEQWSVYADEVLAKRIAKLEESK